MVTNKEFEEIKNTGCDFSTEMELKSMKNLAEVNKIREDSNKRLREFLF